MSKEPQKFNQGEGNIHKTPVSSSLSIREIAEKRIAPYLAQTSLF